MSKWSLWSSWPQAGKVASSSSTDTTRYGRRGAGATHDHGRIALRAGDVGLRRDDRTAAHQHQRAHVLLGHHGDYFSLRMLATFPFSDCATDSGQEPRHRCPQCLDNRHDTRCFRDLLALVLAELRSIWDAGGVRASSCPLYAEGRHGGWPLRVVRARVLRHLGHRCRVHSSAGYYSGSSDHRLRAVRCDLRLRMVVFWHLTFLYRPEPVTATA